MDPDLMDDAETGTLIVWRNLDRVNHKESFAEKVDEKLSTLPFFLRRAYRLLGEHGELSTMVERMRIPPWGIFGGAEGVPFQVTCERNGRRFAVRGKENRDVHRGDLVILESSGGGGYGSPGERPAALHEADLRNGYVTEAAGRRRPK